MFTNNSDKYRLFVFSRAMIEGPLDFINANGAEIDPEPHIVISITNPGASEAKIPERKNVIDILRLQFWDINNWDDHVAWMKIERPWDDPENYRRLFSVEDARAILDFVNKNQQALRWVFCHCEAGISRSSGVAAALSRLLNGNDSRFFGPPYRPNFLVYNTLMKEIAARNPQSGKDYYFDVDEDDDAQFWIVKKSFWEKEGCFDDMFDPDMEKALPPGFSNSAESLYEFYKDGAPDGQAGLKALLAAGFEPLPKKPDQNQE